MATAYYAGLAGLIVLLAVLIYFLFRLCKQEPVPAIILPNRRNQRSGFQTPGSGYGSGWVTPQ